MRNLIALVAISILVTGTPAFADQNAIAAPAHSGGIFVVHASRERPTIAIGGSVVPYREVTLSAQLPGRVRFVAGVAGDHFDAGTTLVALDEHELMAKRSAAYATLSAADADLRNADVQYSREVWAPKINAAPGGMGVPNMFDQLFTRPAEQFFGTHNWDAERNANLFASSTRIQQARSAMLRAQSDIRAIDAKLRDAKSLAPFNGVITQKYVEKGDAVQPGQPLLKFADVTWLQIEADIPARLVEGLKPLEILKNAATFDDHPQPVDVRVAQIYPVANVQRHTIKVKFDIPQGVSKPGMYAKVLIPDPASAPGDVAQPVIPTTAIRYRGSLPIVYVENKAGQPELRMVRLGRQQPDGNTQVLAGIAEGDRVFANPGPEIQGTPPGGGN